MGARLAPQFQQCQRVALRLHHQARTIPGRQSREPATQQVRRSLVIERPHFVLRDPGTSEVAVGRTRRRDETAEAARESLSDELQDGDTRPIKPVRIVHDHQQRPPRSGSAKQGEYSLGDIHPIRGRTRAEPQGR